MFGEYDDEQKKRIGAYLENNNAKKVFMLGDIRLYECPLTWISEETYHMLRAVYLAKDSSVLYNAGGWADQPEWFIDAYELQRTEANEWQIKKSKSSSPPKISPPMR